MDERGEGMSSPFYLSRGISGSSNQSGAPPPPAGFKTQSNPNMSHMGSSFQVEHILLPSLPHGINIGSGGDSVVKKKRGRPRKIAHDNDSHMELSPNPKKNRGRPPGSGWKQRLANVGEWMNSSAGLAFTSHIIHVSVGEDVAEKILSFAQQRPRALCILSGNGTVSAMTLSQVTSSGTVTYEGRFEILCLSGSYLLPENGGPQNRTGGLSISVCSSDGNVIGGAISGRLVASSPVQVVVCSFVYGGNNVKDKTKMEAQSRNEKVLGIELNETSPSPSPVAVPWQRDSRVGLRNSPTEIDLTL